MTWALVVLGIWLALAIVAALVIGRAICIANQESANGTDVRTRAHDMRTASPRAGHPASRP